MLDGESDLCLNTVKTAFLISNGSVISTRIIVGNIFIQIGLQMNQTKSDSDEGAIKFGMQVIMDMLIRSR